MNSQLNGAFDEGADIFNYALLGGNGKFVLKPELLGVHQPPYILPDEKIKVDYERIGGNPNYGEITSFLITDTDGLQYTFDQREYSGVNGSSGFANNYLLSQVQGITPTQTVKYVYENIPTYSTPYDFSNSQILGDEGVNSLEFPSETSTLITASFSPKRIKEIIFPAGKVTFVYETINRTDLANNQALNKIKIWSYKPSTNSFVLVKMFDLVQNYFTGGNNRLHLTEVKMQNSDSTDVGSYLLTYNTTVNLPAYQSKARDFWGYYNGKTTNTSLLAQQSVGYSLNNGGSGNITVGSADRNAYETDMQANILTKITYPTGGYTTFEYEANRYLDGSAVMKLAGGLRIKTLKNYESATASPIVTTYKYGEDEMGNGLAGFNTLYRFNASTNYVWVQPPLASAQRKRVRTFLSNFNANISPFEGSPIKYPFVSEYLGTGQGKTVHEFKIRTDVLDYPDQTFMTTVTGNLSCNPISPVVITPDQSGRQDVISFHWDRGQRLQKTVFGNDGKKKYRLVNTYQNLKDTQTGVLSLLLHKLVDYSSLAGVGTEADYQCFLTNKAFTYKNHTMSWGVSKLTKTDEYVYDNQDDTKFTKKTNYNDFDPIYYFPRLSREVVNAGEIRGKKYVYPFDYQNIPNTTTGELFSIKRLLEKNQINVPIEEVSYYKSSLTATDSLISGAKLTSPFSKEDNSSGVFKSLFVSTNKVYLLESQAFNVFGATPYKSSSDLYNTSPSTYTSDLPKHGLYELKLTMTGYDVYGNLDGYTIANGRTDAFSYLGAYSHDGLKLYLLGGQTQDSGGLNHTTNYAYTLPLLGLSSIKAPNGVFTYFNYDNFGRFKNMLDHNGKILKENAYSYPNRSVTEWMPREELTSVSALTSAMNALKTVSYVDGLGRDLQKIIVNGSPDATKDIVASHILYDAFGRSFKGFIPSPSPTGGGIAVTTANLQTAAETFYGDTKPFTETTAFDNSPLNRPLTNFGAGNAWRTANKSVGMQYGVAPANTIKRFKASSGAVFCNVEGQPTTLDYYGANELQKKVSISERGKSIIEYIDLQGRVVQKEVEVSADTILITSYCFDLYDRLAYVVPPNAYKLFTSTRAFMLDTESDSKEGLYVYKYDRKGQQIQKRIPGNTDFEVMIYDKLYRKVLSRDAQDDQVLDSFGRSRFKFQKFDAIDRPVMSGLTFLSQGYDRQTLQTDFDNHTITSESRTPPSGAGGLLGYANTSFPNIYTPADMNVRMVNYFDDYTWQTDALYNFDSLKAFGTQWTDSYLGMATGSLERNVRTNTWQKMVFYQDFKGRIIQDFHLTNLNKLIRKEYQYRFNGELLKLRIDKKNSSNVLLSTKTMLYEYDHLGRKISYVHTGKPVVKYFYDAIGRLQTKKFSPSGTTQSSKQTGNWTDVSSWLSGILPTLSDNVTINTGQTLTIPTGEKAFAGTLNDKGILRNFGTLNMGKATSADLYSQSLSYHIRGGLRGINTDASGNLTNNLFSYKLEYEDDGIYFDGNIRKQSWRSNIDNVTRSNTFRYDGSSQIKASVFASSKAGENYGLNNINYDANGNILALSRSGATNSNFTAFGNVDNLTYTYQSNSNKLLKIQDGTTTNADLGDFRDGTNTDNDYEYWADGSLKRDKNKKITSITYNYLKRPETLTFDNGRTIITEYDANGTKLKKIDSNGETTDYEEDEIYVNNVLYQTSHDEGRINAQGQYEYNINDHLGNLRVSFRDSSGIAVPTQSIFYDSWGLSMKSMQIARSPTNFNKFQFLNREIQIETGLVDLQNRQYDPQRGQFTSLDQLAELSRRFSPTVYGNNNSLRFIDPDGMKARGYVSASGYYSHDFGAGGEQDNDDEKPKKKQTEEQRYVNHISNYFSFNYKKIKEYAKGISNQVLDFKNTNLIIYGNGKASDNFFSGEFKKGGKTVVMDLGKDNQIFWLMSIYAPSRQFDDGGIPNLIDLFGDSHPMYSDNRFIKSNLYEGLIYDKDVENAKYSTMVPGKNSVNMYYLPTTAYDVSKAESVYGYISITRKQAESGLHLKLLKK